jgi:hypothetical protein
MTIPPRWKPSARCAAVSAACQVPQALGDREKDATVGLLQPFREPLRPVDRQLPRAHMTGHTRVEEQHLSGRVPVGDLLGQQVVCIAQEPLTLEAHQSSRMVVDPLHLFDCSLITDGAAGRGKRLWRQLGASRWSLLFSRRRLVDDAENWLARR